MSAPVTERGRTAVRGRTAAIPAQRGIADGAAPAVPATDPTAVPGAAPTSVPTGRRSAQQKAYARRDERVRRINGGRLARAAAPAGRPQFVLLIMVLLAVGLVATLWLSTAAAADSYRLQDATGQARVLSEQAERLHQEVAVLASAPELARRAGELGMVPVRDPARLVVAPDGSVEVVGAPRAAVPPPPPVPPAPPVPPEGQQPAADGTAPEGTAPEEAGRGGTDAGENGTGENGTGENGTAQLAAPGGDAAGPAEDGGAPAASAEGTREDETRGADAGRRSGQDAAGRDAAGRDGRGGPDTAAAGTGRDAESNAWARAGGGGTDAG
jgi:hypothetical protein